VNIIKAILLYFLAFELVGLHLGHTCIVVQISIVYQVQVIEHHICMSIFYGHENNKVHGMICKTHNVKTHALLYHCML
jgi:hypothetical protein